MRCCRLCDTLFMRAVALLSAHISLPCTLCCLPMLTVSVPVLSCCLLWRRCVLSAVLLCVLCCCCCSCCCCC
jgi:hypothetical protein